MKKVMFLLGLMSVGLLASCSNALQVTEVPAVPETKISEENKDSRSILTLGGIGMCGGTEIIESTDDITEIVEAN